MEDNNVYVNIKINTDGVKLGTKEVSDAIARTSQNMAKYGKAAQASCDSAANAFIKQNQAVANASAEVERLSSELEKLKTQSVKTEEYSNLEKELYKIEAQAQKVIDKQKDLLANGGSVNDKAYKNLEKNLDLLGVKYDRVQGHLNTMEENGSAYTTRDTSAIEEKLATAKQKLAATTNSASLAYEKFGNAVSKAKEQVKSTAKSTIDINKSFKKGLTSLLKYGFGIRSLYIAWRKLRTAMIEGFKTLAKENPEFNKAISGITTQLKTLKNSFAAAFAPLVTAVAPIIESFLRKLNAMMQSLSQFIALLSGSKTFKVATEQQDDYAKSLEKSGGAAKKAKKYMSGLDEIATFTEKDESGGAGGGASFAEKAVDDGALDKFKKLKDLANKIKDLFLAGFKDGLGDWESRVNDIKKNFEIIKDALRDIFTDPRVVASAKDCAKKIIYAFGQIVGALASIGLTIAQNLVGGIAKFLDQNREWIKKKLIALFDVTGEIAELIGNFAAAFAYIFEAFGGENGQQLTANIIGIFVSAFTDLLLLAEKFGRDILNLLLKPIIDNKEEFRRALDNTLGFLASISGTVLQAVQDLGNGLNTLYDEHVKPVFDAITKTVSKVVKMVLDYYNKEIKPVLDKIGKEFKELYEQKIKPVMDKVIVIFGQVMDIFRKLWELLEPYILKFYEVMLPKLKDTIETTWAAIKVAIEAMMDVFNLLADIVSGALQIIIDLLDGDTPAALEHLKETWHNVCNDIKDIVSDLWNYVTDKFSDMFNNYLNNSLVGKIYTGLTGRTVNIGGGKMMNIGMNGVPHLATGAVIPPNAPFLATLGDQRSGNNFEAPEGLLRQVVREESGGGNYQFTAQINRRTLFDEMISEAKLRQTASGRNPFSFA